MRNILVVRRAFHLVTRPLHSTDDVTGPPSGAQPQEDGDDWLGIWDVERTDSDEEEIGGDEGLAKSTNKPKLRMQRSFELLLKSGRVIRFEVSSLPVSSDDILTLTRPTRVVSPWNGSSGYGTLSSTGSIATVWTLDKRWTWHKPGAIVPA